MYKYNKDQEHGIYKMLEELEIIYRYVTKLGAAVYLSIYRNLWF